MNPQGATEIKVSEDDAELLNEAVSDMLEVVMEIPARDNLPGIACVEFVTRWIFSAALNHLDGKGKDIKDLSKKDIEPIFMEILEAVNKSTAMNLDNELMTYTEFVRESHPAPVAVH